MNKSPSVISAFCALALLAGAVCSPANATESTALVVDLRPGFQLYGLSPRGQGSRGTCSVFVVMSAYEYLLGRAGGSKTRISPEFINWASNQISHDNRDGSYFLHALEGVSRYGICSETDYPYTDVYDASRAPGKDLLRIAETNSHAMDNTLHPVLTWISPHGARAGLSDKQIDRMIQVLQDGWPVGIGSAHSLLLVGYEGPANDYSKGVFHVLDSAQVNFRTVDYAYIKDQVSDVFYLSTTQKAPFTLKEIPTDPVTENHE
jgi:hypothetical protein